MEPPAEELPPVMMSRVFASKPVRKIPKLSKAESIHQLFRTPYSASSANHKKLTKAVGSFIIKEGLPIYTVEKTGFREMLSTFDPLYTLPSRSYFSRTLSPAIYQETVDIVKNKLSSVSYFSATTNYWSSIIKDPYMAYTVHWLTDNFQLKSRSLQVNHCPENHTTANIQVMLDQVLMNWDLEASKQVALTTDNASNISKAVTVQGWLRVQCFGHRLNLAVATTLKQSKEEIAPAMLAMKKVIRLFAHSHKKKRLLKEAQVTIQGKNVTVSSVLPTLMLIKTKMVAEPDEAALSSKLKKAVWKYMDDHFKPIPINQLYQKVSFLDPRYKG
ncbi:zinc finger BED domain-containing protein 4-like [Watersipora subatra]|uniref:zinc finger BED domain-containing protein 4-like n=1 Tax=Watersipora subatra TaxID=2589382 RepID=UPI00355BB4BB